MGLVDLERLSHKTEETLGALRQGEIQCSSDAVDLWLRIVDVLRESVGQLTGEEAGTIADCDVLLSELIALLPAEQPKFGLPTAGSNGIKAEPPPVPVCMMTAYDNEQFRGQAEELSCDGYVSKPIDFNELKVKIRELSGTE